LRHAAFGALVCVVWTGLIGAAPALSQAAKGPFLHVVFTGTGTKTLVCDPQANCVSSAVAISWVMQDNIDIGLYRSEAAYWNVLKGHGQLELRTGTTTGCNGTSCSDNFDVTTARPIIGADDQGGRMVLSLPVPLSVTPSAYDTVGVESSRAGAALTSEEKRLLFANEDLGEYAAWLHDTNLSISRGVGSGGPVKQDPHSPGDSVATFVWQGHLSVTEVAVNPPTDRGTPPPVPLLPTLPTQGTPVPTYTSPTSTVEKNPTDFLHLIIDELVAKLMRLAGNTSAAVPATISAPAAPATGQVTGTATVGSSGKGLRDRTAIVLVASINSRVRPGAINPIAISYAKGGLATLRGLAGPSKLTVRITFTPSGKAGVTETRTVAVAPAPTIDSARFLGTAANPTVVIRGTNLGQLPAPAPSGHPSGLNGCPTISSDTGYDYGTALSIVVPAQGWAGGRYRPTVNETDCIDLVVTKFTPTEVEFHLGPLYTQSYPKFDLATGSRVEINVNGASYATTVSYG
jgi:hypothetical protein